MNCSKKSSTLADTKSIANKVADYCIKNDKRVILLNGEMGAGKTTFTKYFAAAIGLKDQSASPTFTILNTYESENIKLLHFDLYRIDSLQELEQTGFFEYIEDEAFVIIEWSNKLDLKEYFDEVIEIEIVKSNTERIFNIKG
ncbi:MAG: tRNA threonylcarbamoyladenosine biosynthesis protein TsaE [Deferribacteres bacterium]|jgi:tRNA threonylcarbamoyladenosine biosynthesis protein TsaE|nr:putative ATPase [Deferribacteraceae bacterium]MDK2792298.1 tRNA threonylcarbamoyladenosine biosynthesis protein TsaE [Deferribacteres bacterium]